MKTIRLDGELVRVLTPTEVQRQEAIERTLRRELAHKYRKDLERVGSLRIALHSHEEIHRVSNGSAKPSEVFIHTLTITYSDLY